MYSTITKDILCMMEDDDLHGITIDYCRSQCANNQHVLQLIDEFDRDLNRYSPITWYTRETFLYKMLNRALRIHDVRTLFFPLQLYSSSPSRNRFITPTVHVV